MNREEVCLGMMGAGRAAELHLEGLRRFGGIPVRKKCIVARRIEQVRSMQNRFGFVEASLDFNSLLRDPEIDVIDICTPPYLHQEMVIAALNAGKHVICEKPLCGYFKGKGKIGDTVSKVQMYETLLESLEYIGRAVAASDKKFMYAENFIYAPAIRKAAEIIAAKKSRILFAKGEESLKGSSSRVAGQWNKTGGGTFIRTGAHPLSAILWLKQVEARAQGTQVGVATVLGDMARITPLLSPYDHRHIAAWPEDVEDFGLAVLTFTDGTKAAVMATDTLLGGSLNYVNLYCNDAVINCRLTMSDMMQTYFLDEERLENVYLSEMLPSRLGWNRPFLEDEIIRGYADEMRDFMECICYDREPQSGFSLAKDTIRIIYAAYASAEVKHPIVIS